MHEGEILFDCLLKSQESELFGKNRGKTDKIPILCQFDVLLGTHEKRGLFTALPFFFCWKLPSLAKICAYPVLTAQSFFIIACLTSLGDFGGSQVAHRGGRLVRKTLLR